jgi:hypothetical protein
MDEHIMFTPEEMVEINTSLEKIPLGPGRKKRTMEDLFFRWDRFISYIEGGYDFTIDDYTNDLCVRDFIQTLVDDVSIGLKDKFMSTVVTMDNRYVYSTDSVDNPLLPTLDGKDLGWWWFRIPKKHTDRFYLLD